MRYKMEEDRRDGGKEVEREGEEKEKIILFSRLMPINDIYSFCLRI